MSLVNWFQHLRRIYPGSDRAAAQIKASDILNLVRRLQRSFVEFHLHSEFKLRVACLFATIAFPTYYYIWTEIFPQPYESITLRAIGCALGVIGWTGPRWPKAW